MLGEFVKQVKEYNREGKYRVMRVREMKGKGVMGKNEKMGKSELKEKKVGVRKLVGVSEKTGERWRGKWK